MPEQAMLPILVNNIDKANNVTILLGFSRYLCKDFKFNNIQMTGNWYLESIHENVDKLHRIISENDFSEINFVGMSKSCTGAFLLSNQLARKFPSKLFKVFAFSAYTTLDRKFFKLIGKLDKAPASLARIWADANSYSLAKQYGDARYSVGQRNQLVYLFYPSCSSGVEQEMAIRLHGMENVTLVPIAVRIHNIFFPFWKKLLPDLKLETFEGQVKSMPKDAYDYFYAMQSYPEYNFHLYSLIRDSDGFIDSLTKFDSEYLHVHDR